MDPKRVAALPAAATGERCCCDPPIITECKTRSGSATICGFPEYIPSIPPRLYGARQLSGQMDVPFYSGADCTGSLSFTSHYRWWNSATRGVSGGTCQDLVAGRTESWTNDGPRTEAAAWEAASPYPAFSTETLTRTSKRWDGNGCTGASYSVTGYALTTLADEDTEAMAEARSTATWSAWKNKLAEDCSSCCVASRTARGEAQYTFSFTSVKFRLGITEGPPDTLYQIAVDYMRKPIASGEWALVATEYFPVVSGPDPVLDPPPDPPVEPPAAHDLWPEYEVPQLAGYQTTIDNIRIYRPE